MSASDWNPASCALYQLIATTLLSPTCWLGTATLIDVWFVSANCATTSLTNAIPGTVPEPEPSIGPASIARASIAASIAVGAEPSPGCCAAVCGAKLHAARPIIHSRCPTPREYRDYLQAAIAAVTLSLADLQAFATVAFASAGMLAQADLA